MSNLIDFHFISISNSTKQTKINVYCFHFENIGGDAAGGRLFVFFVCVKPPKCITFVFLQYPDGGSHAFLYDPTTWEPFKCENTRLIRVVLGCVNSI